MHLIQLACSTTTYHTLPATDLPLLTSQAGCQFSPSRETAREREYHRSPFFVPLPMDNINSLINGNTRFNIAQIKRTSTTQLSKCSLQFSQNRKDHNTSASRACTSSQAAPSGHYLYVDNCVDSHQPYVYTSVYVLHDASHVSHVGNVLGHDSLYPHVLRVHNAST